jgi:ribosome-associated heat shock protein Hsp15
MSELKVRIDKWLWAARFFKTRSLASTAVSGGKIHLNNERIKPARLIQVGNEVQIRRGVEEFVVIILKLSAKRGSATIARTLYEETEESKNNREAAAEQRRLLSAQFKSLPKRKPDKRERRKIRNFIRKD